MRPKQPNQDQTEFTTVSPARMRWIFPVKSCLFRDSLDEMDGIGEAIETEKGAARVWDMTGSVDKLLGATSNGEDDKVIERRSEEVIEAIATLAGDCTKSIVIEN